MSTITRGEFAVILAEHLGLDLSGSGAFGDTNGTEFDAAATALKAAGISTGTSSTTFSPYEVLTREQVAVMVARAYDIMGSGPSAFLDVSSDHWASDSLVGLNEAGIFNGVGGGEFGLGQDFNFDHWIHVVNNLEQWTSQSTSVSGDTGSASSVPETIGSPSVNSDPSGKTSEGDFDDIDDDVFQWAEAYIADTFGLPGLGGWVEEIVKTHGGALTESIIDIALRKTNAYQERFGVVMDGRKEAGLPAISARDILAFEKSARAIMKASGLPEGFYDSIDDFHAMMIADVSPAQLQERINLGYERVAYAPLAVRQTYADYFGVSGDDALAAYFLDPDVAMPVLEQRVVSAEIGGAAADAGFDVGLARAEQLAGRGVDQTLAFTGFARLAALEPLFQETVGEMEDLSVEVEGIDSQFLQDADATRTMQRRLSEREAGTQGGGGAIIDQTGLIGLGSANGS